MPVTTPVVAPTPAAPAPALHVPPAVTSLMVVVNPAHKVATPLIDDGSGFTVISVVATQPARL